MRLKQRIKDWSLAIGKVEMPKPLPGFNHMKDELLELLRENVGCVKDFNWDEYELEFHGTIDMWTDSEKLDEAARMGMHLQLHFTIQTGLDLDKQIVNIQQQKERGRVAAIAAARAMQAAVKG